MKPGDLVKLKEEASMGAHYNDIEQGAIGIIIEWNEAPLRSPFGNDGFAMGYGDGWVQWRGHDDLAIVFEEDLEVIE